MLFPQPFGPMMPIRSPRMMRAEKFEMIGAPPKSKCTSLASNTSFPEGDAASRLDLDLAENLAPLAAFDPQLLERAHPALVSGAARFHSLPDPRLLLRELLVEQGGLLGLGVEHGALLQHVGHRSLRTTPAIDRDPSPRCAVARRRTNARSWLTKSSAPANTGHQILEPRDGLDVEMIGRLVEQQ